MSLFCSAVSVATASDLIDDVEWLVNDLETVDLQSVYSQLMVTNELLGGIHTAILLLSGILVFMFVWVFISNIHKNIS